MCASTTRPGWAHVEVLPDERTLCVGRVGRPVLARSDEAIRCCLNDRTDLAAARQPCDRLVDYVVKLLALL
jgi:hypothetical protein